METHLTTPGVLGTRFINSDEFSEFRTEYMAFQKSREGRLSNSRLIHRWVLRTDIPDTGFLEDIPMLLLCGSEAFVESSELLHKQFPRSVLHKIPLVGQSSFVEAPDTMGEQMAIFIKGVRATM